VVKTVNRLMEAIERTRGEAHFVSTVAGR
jgi:hypothetical protein